MASVRLQVPAEPVVKPAPAAPKPAPPLSGVAALQQRIGSSGLRALAGTAQASLATTVAASAVAPASPSAPVAAAKARNAATGKDGTAAAEAKPASTGKLAPDEVAPSEPAAPENARLTALKQRVTNVARGQRRPAGSKALVAKTRLSAIARGPAGQTKAAAATIDKLAAAEREKVGFETAAFKQALRDRLFQAIPRTKSVAVATKAVSGENQAKLAETMKGELGSAQNRAVGDLPGTAGTPDSAAKHEPDDPPKLVATPPGAQPATPGAAGAVPEKLPDAALDTSGDRKEADAQLASQNLTQTQLKTSDEPSFVDTAETRDAAERHSQEGPAEVRVAEAQEQASAEARAAAALGGGIAGLFGRRAAGFLQVFGHQDAAKAKEEQERARIGKELDTIKRDTSNAVTGLLDIMESVAGSIFNYGLFTARMVFEAALGKYTAIVRKINRDDARAAGGYLGDISAWIADWSDLGADDVERVINFSRREYNQAIDKVIDEVATYVGRMLVQVKQRIADGQKKAADFVDAQDKAVAGIAGEELDRINVEFGKLSASVDARRDNLITKLSTSYEAAKKAIDERAQAFRDANKSWWQKLKEKVRSVIRAIVQIKDMFMSILSRLAGVVGAILSSPAKFLGNLVSSVKRGLSGFIDRFPQHLKQGFFEWLFGTMAKAGIQIPKKFDAAGMFGLLASILGLTVANIRARAVAKVGEGPVKALEAGAGILMVLRTEGLPGLWKLLVDKLTALKDSAIEQIESMLTTEVIKAGITWIIGLLNPAAGFIKACKAIYEIVKFFVNNWDRIVEFVNSVIDSIGAIAKGQLDAASALVEKTLARTIPIIIGFLAGLIGLGNISDKVRKIIERIQEPVNKAIDWLIDKAVGLAKKGAGLAKKAAKSIFNWARAKVGFADADGNKHTIYVEPGAVPVLKIASDPVPAAIFLKLYRARKAKENATFETDNAAKITAVETAIDASNKLVEAIAKLNRSPDKEPTGKELDLLEQLLKANVILSQALSDLVGRDDSVAKNVEEKYALEGVTGTYESIPKPKGDKLTADHQPQAAILEAAAEFDYFDTTGNIQQRADKRAAKGFAINLHFNRHVEGRTFGAKGRGTKDDFVKLAKPVKSKSKAMQRQAAIDLLKAELKQDYDRMIKVADDDANYFDITKETNLAKPRKQELVKEVRGRIKKGEREMLAQDLDSLIK